MGATMVSELREQFRRQWKTIRDLVEKVPDEQWRSGGIDYLVPARQVYHIVFTADLYANSSSYEAYKPYRRYATDWEGTPASELPDRRTTLGHVDEMEKTVAEWLESLGDEGLLSREEGYPWTGTSKLGRALYLLRHNQGHIGEANSELRRRGLPRGKW